MCFAWGPAEGDDNDLLLLPSRDQNGANNNYKIISWFKFDISIFFSFFVERKKGGVVTAGPGLC